MGRIVLGDIRNQVQHCDGGSVALCLRLEDGCALEWGIDMSRSRPQLLGADVDLLLLVVFGDHASQLVVDLHLLLGRGFQRTSILLPFPLKHLLNILWARDGLRHVFISNPTDVRREQVVVLQMLLHPWLASRKIGEVLGDFWDIREDRGDNLGTCLLLVDCGNIRDFFGY